MLTLMVSQHESPSTRAILRHLTFPPGGTKALTYYNSVIKLQERNYFRHLRFGIILFTSDNPALDLLTIQPDLLSKPVDPIIFKELIFEGQIYVNLIYLKELIAFLMITNFSSKPSSLLIFSILAPSLFALRGSK